LARAGNDGLRVPCAANLSIVRNHSAVRPAGRVRHSAVATSSRSFHILWGVPFGISSVSPGPSCRRCPPTITVSREQAWIPGGSAPPAHLHPAQDEQFEVTSGHSFPSAGIIDVGWIAAYLTIGLAAFASEPSSLGVVDTAGPDAPTFASFLAPLVLTFVALAVAGLELQLGRHLDTAGTVMAFALVCLVLVRQTVFALELSKTADSAEADWLRRLVRAALSRASVASTGHDHPPQQGSPS
jgi:hypothetical protein